MNNKELQWANAIDVMESVYNNLGLEDNWNETLMQYDDFVIGQRKAQLIEY